MQAFYVAKGLSMFGKSKLYSMPLFIIGILSFGTIIPATGQANPNGIQGIPQDWTHRHVIFSTPTDKSLAELLQSAVSCLLGRVPLG